MERLTYLDGKDWKVPAEKQQAALERLAGFEEAYEEILARRGRIEEQMEPMRAAGKQKSARFRELLGEKLMLQQMLLLLEGHGLS